MREECSACRLSASASNCLMFVEDPWNWNREVETSSVDVDDGGGGGV